ncbi:DNA-binding FadR family transcriptional regulator [Arthrobacter stackebrandtii]|uniref:DNA-binding FadR family transcriptional regulator n=1 Tax=Arthrobacter stackebrandtii TaxID=272161 RepID=A0ABS4YUI1_9MICC|nr:FCD domain-containing protein [Arthrobacter stackebrandtii]MBP2412130.1 DNA-binding FadR family transcriptional regulator [Arthrobacter stackebrandtii]PYH01932.1 GntR family transcriptional regulator [Arthrobacter stackebrandtii]
MSISTAVPKARFSAQARLRALQADIMELILERDLDAGDPMPTESELCEVLGVGRNTLRESLKVLQALGVIEIRHGFGMFVAPSNFDALADGLTFRGRLSLRHEGLEALQLVDIRQALESGLIGGCISVVSPEHLVEIEAAVVKMETLAASGEQFSEADAEFHRLLFEPLGNDLLMNLMSVFWKVYRKIHVEIGTDSVNLVNTAAEHRDIYNAVSAKDAAAAAELLSRHFDGIRTKIRLFVEVD